MSYIAFIEHLKVGWLQCVRARTLVGVLVIGAAVWGSAWVFSTFSMRQPLVVLVDVALSGFRVLGAFMVLFWIQEAFVRDIERKAVQAIFAYPVSREAYVVGRYVAVITLLALTLAYWGCGLAALGKWGSGYVLSSRPEVGAGLLLALLGVWLDLMVIGAFMLFVVSFAQTKMLPLLIGFAFAIAARGFGPVLDYLRFSGDADPGQKNLLLPVLEKLRWLLPDLSRLDWRDAMLYGHFPKTEEIFFSSAMAIGYTIIMLIAAVEIYRRREFA